MIKSRRGNSAATALVPCAGPLLAAARAICRVEIDVIDYSARLEIRRFCICYPSLNEEGGVVVWLCAVWGSVWAKYREEIVASEINRPIPKA